MHAKLLKSCPALCNPMYCSPPGSSVHGIFQARMAKLAQLVKNLPVMQETQIQSLGWDDPLQKKIAIHSSILAWEIPWTEEPESKELDRAE